MSSSPGLIGLCGYARSGKDTVGHMLHGVGYRRAAWADKLREALLALDPHVEFKGAGRRARVSDVIGAVGWEGAKEAAPEIRDLLQRLGTDVGRKYFGDDIWIRLAVEAIDGPTVFTDCRFPNECDKIRELGGEIWRVYRPGFGPVNGHISESALDDYIPDRTIYNGADVAALASLVSAALAPDRVRPQDAWSFDRPSAPNPALQHVQRWHE